MATMIRRGVAALDKLAVTSEGDGESVAEVTSVGQPLEWSDAMLPERPRPREQRRILSMNSRDAQLSAQAAHDQERAIADVQAHLKSRHFKPLEALSYAARIVAHHGHESGLAGQISARTGELHRYWTLRLGLGFEEATPDSFIVVDDELQRVDDPNSTRAGPGMPNPATRFHLWVYRARPDLNCIVHTHPPYVSALVATGQPLIVAHMDAAMFHDDIGHLPDWPGLPVGDNEGEVISAALGADKHALMLSNHGMLTAGATIAEATYLAVFIERAARMQLRAMAVGTMKPLSAELARPAREFLRTMPIIDASFDYWARQVDRAQAAHR